MIPPTDYSEAVCLQTSPELYFLSTNDKGIETPSAKVIDLCFTCPLLKSCFESALATDYDEDWGIWGGTTRGQRNRMRKTPEKLRLYREKIKEATYRANQAKGEAA